MLKGGVTEVVETVDHTVGVVGGAEVLVNTVVLGRVVT